MISYGFAPDLKCCTHFPYVPNFTLGALLQEKRASPQLNRALNEGHATPLGLFSSPNYERQKDRLGVEGFGRALELACPFLERGQCAIWEKRPGVCTSYFCQSQTPDFWKENERRVSLFEWTMAHEILWRMGFTADETRHMEELRADGCIEKTWYEHRNDPLTLYRRTYELARAVTPGEIRHLMGE